MKLKKNLKYKVQPQIYKNKYHYYPIYFKHNEHFMQLASQQYLLLIYNKQSTLFDKLYGKHV